MDVADLRDVARRSRERGAGWSEVLSELAALDASHLDMTRVVRDVGGVGTREAMSIVNQSGAVTPQEFVVFVEDDDPWHDEIFGDPDKDG